MIGSHSHRTSLGLAAGRKNPSRILEKWAHEELDRTNFFGALRLSALRVLSFVCFIEDFWRIRWRDHVCVQEVGGPQVGSRMPLSGEGHEPDDSGCGCLGSFS